MFICVRLFTISLIFLRSMKLPSALTSFSAFITIVGVILVPLSRFGSVYAWPCGRIAVSVCFFYIGCLCAEWLKGKLTRKWLVAIGVAAAICFGQKYVFESEPQFPIHDHIYWFSRFFLSLSWIIYYLSFTLVGMIVNSPALVPLKNFADDGPEGAMLMTYPFRSSEKRFWKDLISGVICFVLYMIMSILPYVTEFYTTASKALILSIRIVSVIPWVATLIYVYRCIMSDKISTLTMKLPKLTMFIAGLCPGAIILTITNYANFWNRLAAFIALPIMAYILSVLWRFSIRLLLGLYKLLVNKDFGWKDIFIGNF